MRKEARVNIPTSIANVQSYHGARSDDHSYSTNYAFRGFRGNWYFNSDRKEAVRMEGGIAVRANGQPMQGIGLEIEAECRGVRNQTVLAEVCDKIIFPVFKFGADMFKMQNDCSLGGDTNVEIITQPMTISRIRNDYAAYKAMFDDYFPAFRISADSYMTSCGMHVNVSNALFGKTPEQQVEAIRKLYYIINKHYEVFIRALYRDPNKRRWCDVMDYRTARTFDIEYADGSHGNCLNMSHWREGRIEIRLVGGQKSFQTFRNTMETVFHLIARCRTISWNDVDDIVKIFSGCNQYVFKRLRSECRDVISLENRQAIEASVVTENYEID